MPKLFSILFTLFILSANSAFSEIIVENALYTDKDNISASDSNDGRYISLGGTGPFKTIQKLVDSLAPGMTGYVRKSKTPYFENSRKESTNYGGVTFMSGGTLGKPITLSGYPGELVVINQEKSFSQDSKALAGFYIHSGNYITISNFEITNTITTGVMTNPGPIEVQHNIILDNLHIHHLYGGDNTGGVRFDYCNKCVLRESKIHHIYDTRVTSNNLDNEPYGLNAGVHGFRPSEVVIENNIFHNLKRGVFQKTPNDDLLKSNTVRYNIFNDLYTAYSLEVMGYGVPAMHGAEFYGNIVMNSMMAVETGLSETNTQSKNLKIYNNTLYNTNILVSNWGVTDVDVFNNIVVGSNGSSILSKKTMVTEFNNSTSFNLLDYNLYYLNRNTAKLDQYGRNYNFKSLESWQALTADGHPPLQPVDVAQVNSYPALNSKSFDPGFINAEKFNLQPFDKTILMIGRGGGWSKEVGAYGLEHAVGPKNYTLNSLPEAPNLSVK